MKIHKGEALGDIRVRASPELILDMRPGWEREGRSLP